MMNSGVFLEALNLTKSKKRPHESTLQRTTFVPPCRIQATRLSAGISLLNVFNNVIELHNGAFGDKVILSCPLIVLDSDTIIKNTIYLILFAIMRN